MFKARYLLPDFKPPGRIYIHSGLEEVFGERSTVDNPYDKAFEYGKKTIQGNKSKLNNFDFFIGIVDSDRARRDKVLILFTYHGFYNKETNQRITRHFFKSGYLMSEKIEYIDEDTIALLYKEGEFRKTTENLEDYMNRFPHLGRLEPKRGFGELLYWINRKD